jgi:hypothetical protein
MDAETKKYWSQRILGRIVGNYKIKRYIFNRSDIPFDRCEVCKQYSELMPVGSQGKWVCHSCGMKNPEERKRRFDKIIALREAKRREALNKKGLEKYEYFKEKGNPIYKNPKHNKLFLVRKSGD